MRSWRLLLCPGAFCALAARLWAGGSGLNVAVVVNQNSSDSLRLANYYCELRQVPPQNVLRINWTGSNIVWTTSDFSANLFTPLAAMLSSRQLTNQIDYVVLSMDIPFQVTSADSVAINSTTSTLFYGFKPDTNQPCSIALGSASLYAGSESPFRDAPPILPSSNSFLATMITSSNLALAEQIVLQGVASDSTFPTQTVLLTKNLDDTARNVRFVSFDNAIFNTRLRGNYAMQRAIAATPDGLGYVFGFQGGAVNYAMSGVSFAPGAIADNLTSYGGHILPSAGDQLDMLAFLTAGATATYGTVDEPCNYLQKFPSPMDYFYQARGFSLAECYYQSVTNPYQGLIVGEPLAAPFALPPSGAWLAPPANAVLVGTTNLSLQITAADSEHTVSQVDLFVDGTFFQTITNLSPQAGNVLNVGIHGRPIAYTVRANATLNSIAAGLTDTLNAPATTNTTKVIAFAAGDRIELRSTELDLPGSDLLLSAGGAIGTARALTTFIQPTGTNFLDTIAYGFRGFEVTNTPVVGDYLQLAVTLVDGLSVTNATTNTVAGATVSSLVSDLMAAINADSQLGGADGVAAGDWFNGDAYGLNLSAFNLYALAPGWAAAQILTVLSGSTNLYVTPTDSQPLTDNLSDLQPRTHLYITSGAAAFQLTFPFDTTAQADGFHELTALIYEGSNVRVQGRAAQTVRIQNTALSAVLSTLFGASNVAAEATIPFSVVANTNHIASIELFSTGGSLGVVTGQSSASFSVAGPSLDVGLHPFYAVVTAANGARYRTETKWIRLVGPEAPFPVLLINAPPPTLTWPATAGRAYDILAASNLTNALQLTASVTPTNASGSWADTNPPSTMRFYRIRTP
ncbi:MAG: TIGR03790 family protein [Limisphaerales bacterium]